MKCTPGRRKDEAELGRKPQPETEGMLIMPAVLRRPYRLLMGDIMGGTLSGAAFLRRCLGTGSEASACRLACGPTRCVVGSGAAALPGGDMRGGAMTVVVVVLRGVSVAPGLLARGDTPVVRRALIPQAGSVSGTFLMCLCAEDGRGEYGRWPPVEPLKAARPRASSLMFALSAA
ncbi:MAG: hypothetical protein FRX49_09951 [Trebouxia sp. A1-2]|nr:MAG: hypothetical protein FRX49_09951 [Trebouxia sp. A1-2]